MKGRRGDMFARHVPPCWLYHVCRWPSLGDDYILRDFMREMCSPRSLCHLCRFFYLVAGARHALRGRCAICTAPVVAFVLIVVPRVPFLLVGKPLLPARFYAEKVLVRLVVPPVPSHLPPFAACVCQVVSRVPIGRWFHYAGEGFLRLPSETCESSRT